MTTGQFLREWREHKGWSITQLSKKLGMTPAAISRLESDHWTPSLLTLQKYKKYNLDVYKLLQCEIVHKRRGKRLS